MYVAWDNREALTGDNNIPAAQQALLWWSGTMCVGCFGASKVIGLVGSVKGKGGKRAMKRFMNEAAEKAEIKQG
tara:strand:- start:82 stop:303 length:222 start_codon:yes stop_codon:yes gene_type:complete